jgi:tetratricopeptide (TPR) repeat protein
MQQMQLFRLPALLGCVIWLCACSATPPKASLSKSEATLPYSATMASMVAPVPSLEDIFTLTPEQQTEFLHYFNAPERQDMPRHRRLYKFLAQHLEGFNYLGENFTAREAYARKSGNCISLAVLTKALADLAGIAVEFQTIVSAPVFSMKNDVMLSSDHVRTYLYDPDFVPEKDKIYFIKPAIVVDYLPSSGDLTGPRVSEQTFIAMFYRNLAADALLAKQYEQTLALLNAALTFAPDYGGVINLAAVVHRRINETQLAEQFYQYGLKVASNRATLLSNYASLKLSMGETSAADDMLQSLRELKDYDPYLWYLLGQSATSTQQYQEAVGYYLKAVNQAPYVHQLQLELAAAFFRNNQAEQAAKTLVVAAQLAPSDGTKQRYDAKLQALHLSRTQH